MITFNEQAPAVGLGRESGSVELPGACSPSDVVSLLREALMLARNEILTLAAVTGTSAAMLDTLDVVSTALRASAPVPLVSCTGGRAGASAPARAVSRPGLFSWSTAMHPHSHGADVQQAGCIRACLRRCCGAETTASRLLCQRAQDKPLMQISEPASHGAETAEALRQAADSEGGDCD